MVAADWPTSLLDLLKAIIWGVEELPEWVIWLEAINSGVVAWVTDIAGKY